MLKHVLVVWQDIPDRIRVYDYIVTDQETMETLKKCHGEYAECSTNSIDIDAALDWLSKMLENTFDGTITLLYDSQSDRHRFIEPDSVDCSIITGFLM